MTDRATGRTMRAFVKMVDRARAWGKNHTEAEIVEYEADIKDVYEALEAAGKPEGVAIRISPIDRALAAIAEAMTELLDGNKPSRFAETHELSSIARKLQNRRHATGVDDVLGEQEDEDDDMFPRIANPRRFNDAADLSREMLMLAQGFMKEYTEIERLKIAKPTPETRLAEVSELAGLIELRLKIILAGEPMPREIDTRIDHLLQRIGEPHQDPVQGLSVEAEST